MGLNTTGVSMTFVSVCTGIVCTTIGHYGEFWGLGYLVAVVLPVVYGLTLTIVVAAGL